MQKNEENKEAENAPDINFNQLKEELEQKNKQIKNLQNKLDSQDIIITDYYKTNKRFINSIKNRIR